MIYNGVQIKYQGLLWRGQKMKLTLEKVIESLTATFTPAYVATADGMAHLVRVSKAGTNESLIQRKKTQRETLAETAFNKALAKVASEPEKVSNLLARKHTWIADYITRKYGQEEE
jgi:hypothetical protein